MECINKNLSSSGLRAVSVYRACERPAACRLGALPVLAEAMVDSAVFIGVYRMPVALGFTGGFILSALSPTVLVTGSPTPTPLEGVITCMALPVTAQMVDTLALGAWWCWHGSVVPDGALTVTVTITLILRHAGAAAARLRPGQGHPVN